MWDLRIFGFSFYDFFSYFMLYSLLGWMMESAVVSLSERKWVNRGFINGPFCPIYGVGAVLMVACLSPVENNTALLYFGSVIIATVVEFLVSVVLERLFSASWWDYSRMRFNIQGRICLLRSLEWGVLGVLLIRVLQPFMVRLVEMINPVAGEFICSGLMLYLIGDTSVTVLQVLHWREKLERLTESRLELREKLESTKLFEAKKELLEAFEKLPVAEMLKELKDRVEEQNEELEILISEERLRKDILIQELKKKIEKHQLLLSKSSRSERRLTNAFPGLRFYNFEDEFSAFKREIKELRENKKRGSKQ